MKNILLLLVIGGVLLTHLPVQAENRWFFAGKFIQADPTINKIVIDSSFSSEFQELIEAETKKYYNITEVQIKPVSSTDPRVNGILTFTNFNDEDFSSCGCGGYFTTGSWFKPFSTIRFAVQPMIVTPENKGTLIHEIGHSLGLDHESPRNNFYLKKRKNKKNLWLENDLNILGADQMMSYGSRPTVYDLGINPSDEFYFSVQALKEKRYFIIGSEELGIYNGADLLLVRNEKIPAVVNFNKGKVNDGYLTAIGYFSEGLAFITIPAENAKYKVYVAPKNENISNLPNPFDISVIESPKRLGTIKVENGNVKFSKRLARKYGFTVIIDESSRKNLILKNHELIKSESLQIQ